MCQWGITIAVIGAVIRLSVKGQKVEMERKVVEIKKETRVLLTSS